MLKNVELTQEAISTVQNWLENGKNSDASCFISTLSDAQDKVCQLLVGWGIDKEEEVILLSTVMSIKQKFEELVKAQGIEQ